MRKIKAAATPDPDDDEVMLLSVSYSIKYGTGREIGAQPSMLTRALARCSLSPSTPHPQLSTLNFQPSTLN